MSTADICATIYHCLGIDPDLMVPDRTNRPVSDQPGRQADRGDPGVASILKNRATGTANPGNTSSMVKVWSFSKVS